ncbi:MAG: S41 family peptidase [Alphaproteobacteria bacterium]|nr:S41 family peptidase [Alphaproteobacteria bacterium]MDX5368279.1 S41 family peptidase [Alphaproteobacteria bacterium]MDX5463085.1 S41 family peptidase [Alphaproteobacteria bacterium]
MKRVVIAGLTGIAVGLSASVAFVGLPVAGAADSDTYRQLNLFGEIFETVRAQYVEQVDDARLIEAAVNGMLTSLDPHSSYLSPKNFRDMQVQTRGEFGGLGIEVTMENGLVKVVAPIDDTPASRADIRPGDLVTQIDGEPVLGLTLREAVEKMRGPVDTDITLTIQREGAEEPFNVTLTRAIIEIRAVRSRAENDVGVIRVTTFNEHTTENLQAAIDDLKGQIGEKLAGFILDLRNNPGGLLNEAVSVSDTFLERGEIVSTRGRDPKDTERYSATPGDMADGKPIIVLINGGSASASEIVAGALQDHRRAIVLGTQSFGKGSVQTIMPLGGRGALRLTTSRYYTPSGRSIQAKGITPDIEVAQARLEPLEQRGGISEGDLRGHLSNPADEKGQDEAGTPQASGERSSDYQLNYALDLIRGLTIMEQARATQ